MIYLDNAATTPLDPEVIDVMAAVMKNNYGNPSSIHTFGREARVLIEDARSQIASQLNVKPADIFFTSCATEGINTIINSCVFDLGIKHIITSPIEHHAVLHAIEHLHSTGNCTFSYLNIDGKGHIDLNHLEEIVKKSEPSLVCLMHANNEIGNLLPIKDVAKLCSSGNALFLCDTVQTMGKFSIDLDNLDVHFAVCSAHKLHGPKGVGFTYVKENVKIKPMMLGGGQERNMRAGTENIYGITGLVKAFEVAHRDLGKTMEYIRDLKHNMVRMMKENFSDILFNGDSESNGLYTILNVSFPKTPKSEVLLYNLDIEGVAASGGSACSSGTVNVSHVLQTLSADDERISVRFSFSKFNTQTEIEETVQILKKVL